MSAMRGWHFTKGLRLRDGTPLEAGRLYAVSGPLKMCRHGLHASRRAIDALGYARRGCTVSRVELRGARLEGADKACAAERLVFWCADAESTLREFSVTIAYDALERATAQGYCIDPRSREALRAAAGCRLGTVTREALVAARGRAWDARFAARHAPAAVYTAVAVAAYALDDDAVRGAVRVVDAWAYGDDEGYGRAESMNKILTVMLEALAPARGRRGWAARAMTEGGERAGRAAGALAAGSGLI